MAHWRYLTSRRMPSEDPPPTGLAIAFVLFAGVVMAICLLAACARPAPVVTSLRPPPAPLCRVETRVEYRLASEFVRVRRPCLRDDPPADPTPTGDPALDAARREDHYRRLRVWAQLAAAACRVREGE